ncbi:MAG: DUF3570 domain-containing protein [Agitococcus sp.]|nr:DUF3570 domain-containing protein [Agitococcus sp.]
MQLTINTAQAMRAALAAASCGLLGMATVATAETAPDTERKWQVDSALLYYKENNGRVQAAEPIVNFRKDYGDERVLNVKLTLDSLTGASPNGATASSQAQTFTSPSGGKTYDAAVNSQPLDNEFKDTRAAVHVNWEQPIADDYKASIGGGISNEYDFQSASVNGAISKDLNDKNTTLSAGLSIELDSLNPVGGKPKPLSSMVANIKEGNDNKTVVDALLGVTQVINRKMIMQWNYSLSSSSGYHTDPYKLLSVVDSVTGLPQDYLYESRPDSRTRHSLFWQTKYHLTEDVIDLSYRYMTDDWGIKSHTLDLRYRFELGNDSYLEPNVRFYTQTAADFYHYFLVQGQATPQFASADPRLGQFDATTFGIKYGKALSKDSEFSVRLEQYAQTGNSSPSEAIGQLKTQNLFPDLNALVVQFGYSFSF